MGEYTFTVLRKVLASALILSLLWPDVARCMQENEDDLSNKGTILPSSPRKKEILQEEQNFSSSININEDLKEEEKTDQAPLEKNPTIESISISSSETTENITNNIPLSSETKNEGEEKEDQLESATSSSSNANISDDSSALPSNHNIDDDKHSTNESHEEDLPSSQIIHKNIQAESNTSLIEEKKDEGNNTEGTSPQTVAISENKGNLIENKKNEISNIPGSLENKAIPQNPINIIEENEENNSKEDIDDFTDNTDEKQDKEEKKKDNEKDNLSTQLFQKKPSQKTSSLNEEEYEDFLILNSDKLGSNLELSLLQESNVQEDLLKETLAQKILRLLKINPRTLTEEELRELDILMKVEGTWRNHLVWSNLEILLHKALFALTTNKHTVNLKKEKKSCAPLWLHGGPLPLEDKAAIKRNLILKTAGNALEEGVLEPLNALLLAGMGYQIYEMIKTHTWKLNLKFLADFYFNTTDSVSYIAMFNFLGDHPGLFGLLGIPLAFAAVKTVWNMLHLSEPTDEGVAKSIKSITDRSLKWDSRIFSVISVLPLISFLLTFHPLKSDIPSLATLILWEGKVPPETREKAFNAIAHLAKTRKGVSQLTAIESLVHLAHGLNVRNLTLHPHDVEGLLKIKLRAFHTLKEVYHDLPYFSLNKLRTAVRLWEMGQSPSWRVSTIEPLVKAALGGLYVFGLVGIVQILYDYLTCPAKYRERFSWIGGLQPWASDYSKECFDTQVKVFNLIPGQPASTLVGNLTRYHFPNNSYDLDLSNKGITGSVMADIVEGFQRANVFLDSLNITNSIIRNSTNLERILAALPPSITNLDMTDISFEGGAFSNASFLRLKYLTGLQSLNISGNYFLSYDNTLMGKVLQNLFRLQSLRYGWEIGNDLTQVVQSLKPSIQLLDLSPGTTVSQIALGQALAQKLTLHELYLGAIGMSSEGNIALAQGLAAQHNLSVLDLSRNQLGFYPNTNASTILRAFPSSVTDLDLTCNYISKASEVMALSHAVQQMLGLRSFKAGGAFLSNNNALGNSPDFLKALHDKKNLTVLNLSYNSFNDTKQMRDFLNTTLNLEVLDLSENLLTNGAMLAPALSNLGKLKSLKLSGNSFTTEDRMAIWNVTRSFFPKSPFLLDEDLSFTTAYLQSLPSTTTALNFAGLILYRSAALESIMPQVVNLFPNLRELDLSNNNMCDGPGGIEALITYLPQLESLQSLKFSQYIECGDTPYYYQNISYTIGQLPNLRSLDLSWTNYICANSLGKGLSKSHSLRSVNLAGCWRSISSESTEGEGVEQLIQGLQAHPNLIVLDLSYNSIGGATNGNDTNIPVPKSTYDLANALASWPQLQSLNLAYNYIGYGASNSSSYFLEKLTDLATIVHKQNRTLEVCIDGIYNTIWTQGADVLHALAEQSIQDACASQVCTGKTLNFTQVKKKVKNFQEELSIESETRNHELQEVLVTEPATSSSSRPLPFYQPVINALKPWLSVRAWVTWGDKALDSVANAILSYSKRVADDCPNLFPDRLASNKAPLQELNKGFSNDLISPMQLLDQSLLLQIESFNQMQGINHTVSSQMLPSSSQFLSLSK